MFLKLLDGYLQTNTVSSSDAYETHMMPDVSYLVPHLDAAATFAASKLKQILEAQPDQGVAADEDPILPRTLEGSILLCQCLIAAALREIPSHHERELLARALAGLNEPKGPALGELRRAGCNLLEHLIGKSRSYSHRLQDWLTFVLYQSFWDRSRLLYHDRNR